MGIESKIREIANPDCKALTAFYPGAGYDIETVMEATHASTFIFVDRHDPAMGSIEEQLGKIYRGLEKKGGRSLHTSSTGGATYTIRFEHEEKKKEIRYYFKKDVEIFTAPELYKGYDIYFSRYSGPFNKPSYLARMIGLMKKGGLFISRGCDLIVQDIICDGWKNMVPAKLNFAKLGLKKKAEIGDYVLIEKVKDAKNIKEILTPPYFKNAVRDAEGLLKEHESEIKTIFATDPGWREHFFIEVMQINLLYPALPRQVSERYSQRMQRLNERFCRLVESWR